MSSKVHLKLLFYGVSGAGKTEVVKRVINARSEVISCHKKDTLRSRRSSETGNIIDLNFLADLDDMNASDSDREKKREQVFNENKNNCKYDVVFFKNKTWYGVNHDQIINSVDKQEIHLIILGSINGIRDIKRLYRDAIAIYFHTDPSLVNTNLESRGGIDIESRKKRINNDYRMYIKNITLFDHVVLNFWDLDNAVHQVNQIIDFYLQEGNRLYSYSAEY